MYDVKCDELARFFLKDVECENDEPTVKELAQAIQDAVEYFFDEKGFQP